MSDGVCTIPPPGWYCTRGAGHEGPCAAWPDGVTIGYISDDLQKLVDALKAGGCEAASVNLSDGIPLKVESLETIMKCVTFLDPDYLHKLARWSARAARVCRFLRLRFWADLFFRAEGHFLADYEHTRIRLNRSSRRPQDAGAESP